VNPSRFSLEELQALVNKASVAAAEAPEPSLSYAFRRLAEAADMAGAALFRFAVMTHQTSPGDATAAASGKEPVEAPSRPPDGSESAEGYGAPPEPEEAPEAAEAARGEDDEEWGDQVFMVRPKTKRRYCAVCNEPQWKTENGWVCKNGHGSATA
jgi:hypothetical protein